MRETEILVEQQPPQGVFVCDHAVLVINKLSPGAPFNFLATHFTTGVGSHKTKVSSKVDILLGESTLTLFKNKELKVFKAKSKGTPGRL